MASPIDPYRDPIFELCRRLHVRRLELFGSAASGRFNPDTSDFDFLVEFEETPLIGIADQYFGLLEGLEEIVQRKVDLVMERAITNPYFREGVNRTRAPLYAA
jgi:predicted nucleotidyltransferase